MPFQDQAESLASRLHLQAVPRAAYIGLCVLLAGVVGLGAFFALRPAGGFQVEAAEASNGADTTVAVEREGEGASSATVEGQSSSVDLPSDVGGVGTMLCVHVDGAVAQPGVYYLAEGSRVADAVAAAGGAAGDGCTAAVNLAQRLQDGQQIVVPTQEAVDAGTAAVSAPGQEDAGGKASAAPSGLVNINRATVEELQALSGIGEATARKIVADREANGPFSSLEDLMRVSGIGEKKFAALKDSLCL